MNDIPRANEEFDANGNNLHLDSIIDVDDVNLLSLHQLLERMD